MKYRFCLICSLIFTNLTAQPTTTNPAEQSVELGQVSWYRNYDQAMSKARKENKSVLILFQEVPGCATCRHYGQQVLSHPLMVEAIENLFVPLLIHNNKAGADRQILRQFDEPAWNNPVVRIVDDQGKDVVDRLAGDYSSLGLYRMMERALAIDQRQQPEYLKLLGQELAARQHGNIGKVCFKMYCFWSGEAHFGALEGVLSTEPGFVGGAEVVRLSYDKNAISQFNLTEYADQANCTAVPISTAFRKDKDPQYYLKQTPFKYVPLSPLQRTRINSALGLRQTAEKYLSPRQLVWLRSFQAGKGDKKVRYSQDFAKAWADLAN